MTVPIYVLNIVALIALRFVGHKAKGAESWFVLGPIRVQPAEFMKIGVVLMLAKIYHDDFRPGQGSYNLWRLWKPVLAVGVPFVLVLVQPDLGTALMIFLSSLTVLIFGKVRWYLVALMVVGLLAGAGIIWNDYIRDSPEPRTTIVRHHLKKHQSQRISGWLDPEADLRGSGYHAAQSKIAVGSGGMTGKGWREGTQTGLSFLPEQHTDFIFSVWAEEHGFLSCLVLLALYGGLFSLALAVGFNARDRFGAFVAVGVTAMLFWQVFENIGMVIGLLPVTGITLPLMSYGGSSMLSVMLSIGLLVNISMRRHMF
ncbi:rod shape-determining protein [Stigmatella aurantiaca DW4/3-1]|nr:rod shape-determining protein [Stigmatella aurantiaca DW4/3-1]